MIYKLFS